MLPYYHYYQVSGIVCVNSDALLTIHSAQAHVRGCTGIFILNVYSRVVKHLAN